MNNKTHADSREKGYIFLGVLFVLSLSLMVGAGLMRSVASNSKLRSTVKHQTKNYYEVESTLSKVVAWMQLNSKSLVSAFTAAEFSNNFDLGSPVIGDNDGLDFKMPTMVKMLGTNDSVLLSNNAFFGTSAFPATTHIDSGASFDAVTEFESADFGEANARVILVWARETAGNYQPIFRVDVMTGNNPDRGVHSFSYIYSELENADNTSPFLGFYGEDSLTTWTSTNKCNSYQYTYASGAWSKGAVRSNCTVNTDLAMVLRSKISGNANTNLVSGITLSGSGLVSGAACDGPGCHTIAPTSLNTWATDCPVHQGDLTINSNTTLTPSGSAPSQNCWRDITVNSNKTLTFDSTAEVYHIRKLEIKGNGNLAFANVAPGDQITIYVEEIVGDKINGNALYNMNNAPQVLKLYYTGTRAIKLNGTAAFNVCIDSPLANVTLQGNFNFHGGIKAKNLTVTGNSVIFADEAGCGGTTTTSTVSDLNFSLKKASQRYRL